MFRRDGRGRLRVFEPITASKVRTFREGSLHAVRLVGAVEVEHQVVLRGLRCDLVVEVHHRAVVTIHAVDHETAHAPFFELRERFLHLRFDGPPVRR